MDDDRLIRNLVGDVTQEQLRNVEYALCEVAGIFVPTAGPCYYSLGSRHSHPSYSFILAGDDSMAFDVDGHVTHTRPGFMYLFSPAVEHHEITEQGFSRYMAFLVDRNFFESLWQVYGVDPPLFKGGEVMPAPGLESLMGDFIMEGENGLPGCEEVMRSLVSVMCHTIIRSALRIGTTGRCMSGRVDLNRVISWIGTHCAGEISVEDMAERMGLSSSHFTRIFRQEMGMTPWEYLVDIRLRRARLLLASTSMTLTEIAHESGFAGSSHFSAAFRKKYDTTPSAWRMTRKDAKKRHLNKKMT